MLNSSSDVWQLLNPRTLEFKDERLERKFSASLARASSAKMGTGYLAIACLFAVLMAQMVSADPELLWYSSTYLPIIMASLVGWKLTKTSIWWQREGFSETFSLISFGLMSLSLAMGITLRTWVGSGDGIECKMYPRDEDLNDRTGRVQFHGLAQGMWPGMFMTLVLNSNVVRFYKLRGLLAFALACHFLRTIVLQPISPSRVVIWCGCCYLTLPVLVLVSARNNELNNRELFLCYQNLSRDNASLTAKLEAAEKALAFEQPTENERAAVMKVFGGTSGGGGVAELSQYVVPFEELEFHERVGAGAFGEVIRATFCGTVCVAKRLLRSKVNEENVKRVLDEVLLLSKLQHPNVVQFLGVSWNSIANLCILFEYVARGDLTHVLRDPSLTLTWDDPKLRMAIDVAQGVAYLHARLPAVLHRDLKPDNILVSSTFSCKITDFGASRDSSDGNTMTMVGTAVYMAPEIYVGDIYSSPVDVYSFGLTLWEMHTHTRPFQNSPWTQQQLLHKTAVMGVRPKFGSCMPQPLQQLITRCWAASPSERPTMADVVRDLCQMLVAPGSSGDDSSGGGSSRSGGGSIVGGGRRGSTTTTPLLAVTMEVSPAAAGGGGGEETSDDDSTMQLLLQQQQQQEEEEEAKSGCQQQEALPPAAPATTTCTTYQTEVITASITGVRVGSKSPTHS